MFVIVSDQERGRRHVSSLVPWIADPAAAPDGDAVFDKYHGDEWGLYSIRMVRTRSAK